MQQLGSCFTCNTGPLATCLHVCGCILQLCSKILSSAVLCVMCRFEKLENGPEGRDDAVTLALELACLDIE